jgi:hypothetical protein
MSMALSLMTTPGPLMNASHCRPVFSIASRSSTQTFCAGPEWRRVAGVTGMISPSTGSSFSRVSGRFRNSSTVMDLRVRATFMAAPRARAVDHTRAVPQTPAAPASDARPEPGAGRGA